ncbi:MAG TPA: 5-oxoprolinase subunit PxpA [Gemmatimonadaceae bacterium]|nr:5-oxoprolinase subunit PxpA [Gemmatimonadaceae bacterium]
MPLTIDINADIGEGAGTSHLAEDSALLELISSANIACGFHAGDATSMRETVRASRSRGVAIGAHPSYPDLTGFGRRELGLATRQIRVHVAAQVKALRDICTAEGARLSYVKPHGALYNRASRKPDAARAVIDAIREVDGTLVLLGLAGSEMQSAAENAGIRFASEAFADRAYGSDGFLVPRNHPGATIEDVDSAVARAVQLVKRNTLTSIDGVELPIHAASLCVHGDNPRALQLVTALRSGLESAGVRIAPFAA